MSFAHAAVTSAYRAHAAAVRRKLRAQGIRRADIDDLTQHVFEIAMVHFDELPCEHRSARRWLAAVARKLAANWHRLFVHKYETQDEGALEHAISQPEDTENAYALRDIVRLTLARLHPEEREILVRWFLLREPSDELAARFKLSRSGVHRRINTARQRFVEALQSVVVCLYSSEGVEGRGSRR